MMSDNAILEEQQENEDVTNEWEYVTYEQKEEDKLEKISDVEDAQVIEKAKELEKSEEDEDADKKIMTFLREKGLSKTLIKTLINTGLTNENVRLLKTLDLTDDDVDNLRDLWQAKIVEQVSKSSDSINSTLPGGSSSSAHLSPNSVYLKRVLSKPLIQALREIVAKQPADPVEYLGHWLLHFKVCEELSIQRKEREVKLFISQEKLKPKKVEETLSEWKKEEVPGEDLNYFDYDEYMFNY
ncbi:60S ribosome subunit biogenesis protein NOP8-like [Pseudomyrmex gracilis]|uniref:60S ribosome subunit biogenesis protein NOP8-like n=1 Tax=Pseudomyrmex gracilis TaxID=219809 RepID=UPI00099566D3|nr:60S ribosome subunit biogenesis protein NOP8-like [Pseudomyrmex gracilis]